MLEGLEIAIVNKKDAFNPFFKARIDPEFFQRKYTSLYDKIIWKENDILSNIAFVSDGEHGNAVTYPEGYSKYYGARNVLQGILSDNNVEFITKEHHQKLKKTQLKPRDLLISCVGANIAHAAIVPDNVGIANIVRNVALIRSNSNYSNEYLLAYFRGHYGKNLYYRMNTGNAQPLVSLDYINTIPVYKPSGSFQTTIKDIVTKALIVNQESTIQYQKAETLLLETLGLNNFEPTAEAVNVKNFKESFLSSGRLDAEYYQKKYEDYEKVIKSNELGFTYITNEYSLIKNVSKKDKEYYNYIEIGDVNVSDGSAICNLLDSSELPANAKTEVEKGDILISKVRSNRGAVTIIDFEVENLIVSGAFTVLREKTDSVFSNETLKVLLRTPMYKDWLLQFNIGTQYPVIRDEDILNMPIPKIPKEIQLEITQKIQLSQSLKKQSEQLLETAKRSVEIAIEDSEEVAMQFINKSQTYN